MTFSSTIARSLLRSLLLLVLLCGPLAAQDTVRLVYFGMAADPHYQPQPFYTGLSLRDRHRPIEGVRLGLRDTRVLGRALGLAFAAEEVIAGADRLAPALAAIEDSRPAAILLDLPPDGMAEALQMARDDTLFINLRDRADHWRHGHCAPNLLHAIPSEAMLADALAQYLRARNWRDVLLIRGPTEADAAQAAAARASAGKFGLRIAAERSFELTNDPRRRDEANIALLSGGVRHDVVWLVDDVGDFGRFLPYATYAPRPVVGSEGLVPRAWHWTFERYGAPQLNQRFRRLSGRDMSSEDWAGWAAVKAVADAALQAGSADPAQIAAAHIRMPLAEPAGPSPTAAGRSTGLPLPKLRAGPAGGRSAPGCNRSLRGGDDDLDQNALAQLRHAEEGAHRQVLGVEPGRPGLVQPVLLREIRGIDHRRQQLLLRASGLGQQRVELGADLFGLALHVLGAVVRNEAADIDGVFVLHDPVMDFRADGTGDHRELLELARTGPRPETAGGMGRAQMTRVSKSMP